MEDKVDIKMEENAEDKMEEKIDIKTEDNVEIKTEEKVDNRMEENRQKKVEERVDNRKEENKEKKVEEKMDKKTAKKLAKERLLLQLRRDLLTREAAIDEITLAKIKDKWFDTLLSLRIPEMQDNLRHILHYMEKLIESDSYRKSLFEIERQEAEEQYLLQGKSHTFALEKLYNIYERRVKDINDVYNESIAQKKDNAEQEFKLINERETAIQENLQTMLFMMEQNRDKKEEVMNCDMFLKIDDERSKNTELLENLRSKLDKKIEKRWSDITSALVDYKETTQERRKQYEQLKMKDDQDSKIIHQQMKKTQKLFEQLEDLRKCQEDSYAPKELISVITDLEEEKTKFFQAFKYLKKILGRELKVDEYQLKTLTVASNTATEGLKKLCTKGEQILTLYRICRKLETEEEKVLPVGGEFQWVTKIESEVFKKRTTVEEDSLEHLDDDLKKYDVLLNFWKKVGRIRLSCMVLVKCSKNLMEENIRLKKALVAYLKRVSARKTKK